MAVPSDNRLVDCPMVPVTCGRCGARVLVRKGSWNQTSVQWNADASAGCRERRQAEGLAPHASRGVFLTCAALTGSIVRAVGIGDLPIVDEIGDAAT